MWGSCVLRFLFFFSRLQSQNKMETTPGRQNINRIAACLMAKEKVYQTNKYIFNPKNVRPRAVVANCFLHSTRVFFRFPCAMPAQVPRSCLVTLGSSCPVHEYEPRFAPRQLACFQGLLGWSCSATSGLLFLSFFFWKCVKPDRTVGPWANSKVPRGLRLPSLRLLCT